MGAWREVAKRRGRNRNSSHSLTPSFYFYLHTYTHRGDRSRLKASNQKYMQALGRALLRFPSLPPSLSPHPGLANKKELREYLLKKGREGGGEGRAVAAVW